MKVSRKQLVAMLVELGYAGANKYDDAKLLARIAGLKDEQEPETDELLSLYRNLAKAGDEEVEIIDDSPKSKASSKKAKPEKAAKSSSSKKAGKKAKKAAKPAREVTPTDAFGSRVGTRAAKINATFSAKPMTIAEITKKSKVKGTIHTHVRKLLARGYVKKDKEGNYSLKK